MPIKVDTFLAGLAQAERTGADARAAGYDGMWTRELSHDPFLPLAVAAPVTEPLDPGTSIVVAFARRVGAAIESPSETREFLDAFRAEAAATGK